ncbi:hypothetical protein V2J09_020174 [Rumex salicifolius]
MSQDFVKGKLYSLRNEIKLKENLEIGSSNYLATMYKELWRASAGPLVHLPQTGETVFYFPQGHLEQPAYDLPSKILCRVININLGVDTETDEVYAQITLLPEFCQDDVDKMDPFLPELPRPVLKSFYKKLTITDISSKLHVRQHDANECFPQLDMTQKTPSNPKRHVLTTGWKLFVTKKRLSVGDSVIFIRGENGSLRVGIRRVSSQKYTPYCYLASDENKDLSTQFIVGKNKYLESAKKFCSIGLRFSMKFEEGHNQTRYCNGSIIDIGGVSSRWADSKWRCLKVKWDDPGATMRPQMVSPWEIDPIKLNIEPTRRNQVKNKERLQPNIHDKTWQTSQLAIDPLISSQQFLIQDDQMGQPWLADNWLQDMLNDMELQDQCNLQIPNQDEAVEFKDLGQIFGNAENGGMNMIVCSQFPTLSPPIYFSELHGERVTVNSEDSVQGRETRKRKATSTVVGDDRQVKRCCVDSNSNETHYSSASEGEVSIGKSSQDSSQVECPENGNDRGFVYRVWDRIFGPLVHQIRNFVAK